MNKNPNIIVILTDQHMVSSIGRYGSKICKTPNLDSLAEDGVTFTNAYASCPICTPARASIQTGLYPFKHGMQTNIYTRGCMIHELPDNPMLLSRRLQQEGYQTGYTGKWHLGFGDNADEDPEYKGHLKDTPVFKDIVVKKGTLPSDVGYYGDDFPGHGGIGERYKQYKEYLKENNMELKKKCIYENYPRTEEILSGVESTVPHFLTNQAIKHLGKFKDKEAPFFYMLNFWGPHEPYNVAKEYVDLYRDTPIPEWESFREPQDNKPVIHNAHRDPIKMEWSMYETFLRYYYAGVTAIDAEIGRLLCYLKDNHLYEDTIIIFSADHGESLGVHGGLKDKSFFMYEEICKIPLIIKTVGENIRKKEFETRLIGTCDLYSTVLEFAGVDRESSQRDGLSLVPLLNNEGTHWRDCVVTESSGLDFLLFTQRMIRYKSIKYVFNCGGMDELYDLEQDPREMNNLINNAEYTVLLHEMQLKLAEWMEKNKDGLLERYKKLRAMI